MNPTPLSAARTPFIRLLLPLLAGILCRELLPVPTWVCIIPFVGGMVLWSVSFKRDSIEEQYRKRSLFGTGLFLLVFAIGIGLHGIRTVSPEQPPGFYPIAIAHLDDNAVEKANSYYCPVTITALSDSAGTLVEYREKAALYLEKSHNANRLEYGDLVAFEFRLKKIQPNANPLAFDFASYMKHKGIGRSQYLHEYQWRKLGSQPQSVFWSFALQTRQKLADLIQSCHLSPNSTALLNAMLLGERENFPPDLKQYFSAAGLSHILAVSGLHMGVVAFLIYLLLYPLSRFTASQKPRALLTLLFLWLYACITGLSPSAIRACIMASFLLTAIILDRRNSSLNALFAAAFFMLLYDTNLAFDAGFQMSFSAVAAILLFYAPLNRWGNSPHYVVRWLSSCVAVSVAAQIGALPIAIYYFHTIPLLFLVGNLFVLPLLPFIFGLSFLLLFLAALHFPHEWLGKIVDSLLTYIERLSYHIDRLPLSHIDSVWLEERYLWLYFIGGVLLYIAFKNHSKRALWAALGLGIVFLIADLCNDRPTRPEIIVFDSRQSTVVQLSDRAHCYLLLTDSLPDPAQELVGKEYRMKHKQNRPERITPQSSTIECPPLFIDYPFARFYGKRLLLLDSGEWRNVTTDKPLTIDYAIVGRGFKGGINDILGIFDIQAFIIGAEVHPGRALKLQNDCIKRGIPCHDIRTQGVWIVSPLP